MLEFRNNSPVFAIAHLSLSLVFYILHSLIIHIYYMLDIFLCLIDICLGLFAKLVFNQESHSGTSTLNLEEF